MSRELVAEVSKDRLREIGRSFHRRVTPRWWRFSRIAAVVLLSGVMVFAAFSNYFVRRLEQIGFPYSIEVAAITLLVVYIIAFAKLQGAGRNPAMDRTDLTAVVTVEEQGLRFSTSQMDHFFKWHGITRLLLERDGLIVSNGNFFCFLSDSAFADPGERNQFVAEIYSKLTEDAQALSKPHIGAALGH